MAKANIKIGEDVTSAWMHANQEPSAAAEAESKALRYIALRVDGEAMSVSSMHERPVTETDAEMWANLAAEAGAAFDKQAAAAASAGSGAFSPGGSIGRVHPFLWLVCVDGPQSGVPRSSARWVIVSWTPESTGPRLKMIYASARDDLKKALGAARFEPDYHVSDKAELNAETYATWRKRDARESMSTRELERAEVHEAVAKERGTMPMRMATLTKVPFKAAPELNDAFAKLAAVTAGGEGAEAAAAAAPGWVEVRVDPASTPLSAVAQPGGAAELLSVVASGPETDHAAIAAKVTAATSEPRFFLCRPSPPGAAHILLIYHCPEMSKPKARMLYSTAKAAIQEAAAGASVTITRNVETRDADDVTTALTDFAASPSPARSAASVASPDTAAAAAAAAAALSSPLKSPNKFGGVGLPGMGAMALPGMGASPLKLHARVHSGGGDSTGEAAASEGSASPATEARASHVRMAGGMALPGMAPGAMALPGMGGLRSPLKESAPAPAPAESE